MKTWQDFVDEISDSDMHIIIADHNKLAKDGFIGDCLLRTKAEEWIKLVGFNIGVLLVMLDIVFYAYKRFAEYYFRYEKSLKDWQ